MRAGMIFRVNPQSWKTMNLETLKQIRSALSEHIAQYEEMMTFDELDENWEN